MTYDGDRQRLPVYEDTPEYRRRFVTGERRQVRVTVGWWALRDFYDAIRARLGRRADTPVGVSASHPLPRSATFRTVPVRSPNGVTSFGENTPTGHL